MKRQLIAGLILLVIGLADVLFWFSYSYQGYIEVLGYLPLSFFTVPIVALGLVVVLIGAALVVAGQLR